jgi:hypothetical protein
MLQKIRCKVELKYMKEGSYLQVHPRIQGFDSPGVRVQPGKAEIYKVTITN